MMYGYNPYEYEFVKMKQNEVLTAVRTHRLIQSLPKQEQHELALRKKFFRQYQIRRILFRLAPRLASRLVL